MNPPEAGNGNSGANPETLRAVPSGAMERSEHGSRWRGRERGRTLTRAQRSEGCVAGDCVEAGNGAPCDSPKDGAQPRSGAPRPPGLSKGHISALLRKRNARIEAYAGSSFLKVTVDHDRNQNPPPKRGDVLTFSKASRRRLLDKLAQVRRDQVPVFVTLTYPDDFPAYREDYKNHLDLFGQRLRRRWSASSAIWKIEFKVRLSGVNAGKLAPHYHLFVFGAPWRFGLEAEKGRHYRLEPKAIPGTDESTWLTWVSSGSGETIEATQNGLETGAGIVLPDESTGGDNLKHWMSRVWYDVVSSGDIRHFRAGTRVEKLRSIRGAFKYAAKGYMGKDIEAGELPVNPGRFWGVIGRTDLPLGELFIKRIPAMQAFQLLRLMRRYRRAHARCAQQYPRGGQMSAKLYCNADGWLARWQPTPAIHPMENEEIIGIPAALPLP